MQVRSINGTYVRTVKRVNGFSHADFVYGNTSKGPVYRDVVRKLKKNCKKRKKNKTVEVVKRL